jgi:dTDP-4-dehydrorhamnose reductase
MKVLVTGAKGQLGRDVVQELEKRKYVAIGVGKQEMDITDSIIVRKIIIQEKIEAIVHCAAYTSVDAAEEDELCREINVNGTRNIAMVCKELDIPMMYISTDYVFDGTGANKWLPRDQRNPINVYGQTKCEGEYFVEDLEKFFIIRTAWVFGMNGKNFVTTMLKLAEKTATLSVIDDQIGSPTYTVDLAILIVDMITTNSYGIYHATNEGFCSWYEFAKEIFSQSNIDVRVQPVSSEAFSSKAKRPYNSRLCKEKLLANGFNKLPLWQDAVARFLSSLQ